jgi:hypothetical protein
MTKLPPSEYIVYVDESGDHGLATMDPAYPVFVLAFCVFKKEEYIQQVVPALQRLKFEYFGHDLVVLHEHAIRKQLGVFRLLNDRVLRQAFMADLGLIVEKAPMTVIAATINKAALKERYATPHNPYFLGLQFCLERLGSFLQDAKAPAALVHVVFESRGRREDDELELEFRRLAPRDPSGSIMCFEPVFASKGTNSTGLQIADSIARPIGRHVLDPRQPNRAYDIVERKLRRSAAGKVEGYGLKSFP